MKVWSHSKKSNTHSLTLLEKLRHFFTESFKTVARYKIVFLSYFVLLGAYSYFLFYRRTSTVRYLDLLFGEGFSVSLSASMAEDLLFFGAIGILVFYITTRKPEDEEISSRIRSVTNGRNVSEAAKGYFEMKTREVLAYNSKSIVTVKLKEYRADEKALKVYVEYDNTITNMCKDVPFTMVNARAIATPAMRVGNSWGQVTHLTIEDKKLVSEREVIVEGDVMDIPENGYRKEINYRISEDSEARYKFCFNIWSEFSGEGNEVDENWFYTFVNRYTDSYTFCIINEIDRVKLISLRYKYTDRSDLSEFNLIEREDVLGYGEQKILVQGVQLHLNDKFCLFFSKIELDIERLNS